jgi:hypothetical protein
VSHREPGHVEVHHGELYLDHEPHHVVDGAEELGATASTSSAASSALDGASTSTARTWVSLR